MREEWRNEVAMEGLESIPSTRFNNLEDKL